MIRTLLCLLVSSILVAPAPRISFQNLPAGESIHVEFTSSGCFHYYTYQFIFRRATTLTAEVFHVKMDWNNGRPKVVRRTRRGTVRFTNSEVEDLECLLSFYRSERHDGCTTTDEIRIAQMNGTDIRFSESYYDGSCATHYRKDLMPFTAIMEKLPDRER